MLASIKANGGSKNEYYKADTELMAKHCIQDCILTAKLGDLYIDRLRAEGLLNFFYQDEVMPLYREVTLPMVETGIRLDIPALQQAKLDIEADIEAIENRIHAAIADKLEVFTAWFLNKDYPPARTGTFAQGIATYYSLPLPRTKAGKYSLAEAAIEALPPSLGKSVLMKQEYVPTADVAAIQRLLYAEENGSARMFNLSSGHHLKKLFFDTLGETPLSKTPTGQPQADDDFLQAMAKKYDWAHDLQILRKLQKLNGTYITRFLDEQEEGIFYAQYKQHGTISGRLSGDFQQLPRPIEEGDAPEIVRKHVNKIRAFFISRPGCIFVDDDYNSAEPRIFAHISNEPGIQEIFASGEDFYSKIALLVEDLKDVSAHKKAPNYLGKVNKAKRQAAKVYALGIPYSMSGYKLQFELNIPLPEAEALVKKYLDAFPNLKNWMQSTYKDVKLTGRVVTQAGRIRRLPKAKEIYAKYGDIEDSLELWKRYNNNPSFYAYMKKLRRDMKNDIANGCNVQVQGLVASMINRASIAIAREFRAQKLEAVIVAQLHDQLVVECAEGIKEQVGAIMQEKMENTMKFSVPMVAEPSFGYNLRDSKGD